MNLQGTLIGEKDRLYNILLGLKLTFDSKKDTDRDGLRNNAGLMRQVYNQLYATCEKLRKQDIDVNDTLQKAKQIMSEVEGRMRELGIR